MGQKNDIAIDMRNVNVRARGGGPGQGRLILRDFSLRVRTGGKAVLYGPSGSGKTTALKALEGFVAQESGEIYVRGKLLDDSSVWDLRRLMAYVPQHPEMGAGTVREVLMRPFGYKASSDLSWDEKRAMGLFSEFLLEERLMDDDIARLSGGERQRVALASSLLLGRPVLVLDEPTSSLDRKSKQAVVRYLQQRQDLTLVAAAHDDAFMECADQVVHVQPPHMAPGRKK